MEDKKRITTFLTVILIFVILAFAMSLAAFVVVLANPSFAIVDSSPAPNPDTLMEED